MDDTLDLIIPPELEQGSHAEWLSAWFSRHHLSLDFATQLRDEGLILTARIRVPVTAVLDLLDALQSGIRDYELLYGEIRRPRRRGEL